MPNKISSQERPTPQESPPQKPAAEPTKPIGFFGRFTNPFSRENLWTQLINTKTLTPTQVGKLQALATVRAAGITGGFALLAGLAAAGAAGFVWREQQKLDSQAEELLKEKQRISKAQNDLDLQKSQQKILRAQLIDVSADREGLHAGLQVSEKIIKDYCKGENTSCFQKHKEQITTAKAKAEIDERENITKTYATNNPGSKRTT